MHSLTPDQVAAGKAVFSFLMSKDKIATLSGAAGTGKSTLMKHIAEDVFPRYLTGAKLMGYNHVLENIFFTATTHKACHELDRLVGSVEPVQTIHSFMYIRPSFDGGYTPFRNFRPACAFLIVDEASMVDSRLFDLILQGLETRNDIKILFVGDHAQLPPVKEGVSRVFTDPAVQRHISLTQPVRNAGQPALMQLCQQLRNTVDTGYFRPIVPVPDVIDHLPAKEMEQELTSVFSGSDPEACILTYTNGRAHKFTQFIRQEIQGLPEHWTAGELVISDRRTSRVNQDTTYRIEDIKPTFEFRVGHETITLPIPRYFLKRDGDISRITVIDPEGKEAVVNALKHVLITKKEKLSLLSGIKDSTVGLRHPNVSTVHKAQGSTYDTVYVDIGNIGTSHDPALVARLLYVACSRARKRVCLFGNLPPKYQQTRRLSTCPTTTKS